MPPLTRGPLPARVYWRRRMLLLTLAVLLVVGLARLLGSGSDASSEPEARPAAATASTDGAGAIDGTGDPSSPPVPTDGTLEATPDGTPAAGKHHASQAPVLAEPDGPCAASDIVVTPEVRHAVAGPGDGVRFELGLQTREAAACTWHVSARTLTMKITSGHDEIWSSQQCPHRVPNEQVVVRRDQPTSVVVTWNGRRSEDDCPRQTDWAMPGYYHVNVAALAGEPTDQQFELRAPRAPVITRSPEPQQSGKHGGGKPSSDKPSAGSSASAD
ncbi:hypothetical protein [Nocardioides panaciterrulae]|uniref:DUF4232 domain-containing protein n=1 Tax=Nocardioides panaciterrulae TaxID=661492 RepID=A0A7Y9E972_9ACTN|nr:hypothetical protein [Nocardioides panaciterrulae]NYD43528.1 hypothetical protein [Nocardioides panaciterrulae]